MWYFKCQEAVVVEHVTESPIFPFGPSLEVVLDAGVRAVQSTPLIGRSGTVLGIISTHWREPYRLSNRELQTLHCFSCNVSSWID